MIARLKDRLGRFAARYRKRRRQKLADERARAALALQQSPPGYDSKRMRRVICAVWVQGGS